MDENTTAAATTIESENTPATATPMDNWKRPFWRSVFAGSDGGGSSSRVVTAFIITNVFVCLDFLVFKNRTVPEHILDFGMFAALLVVVTYCPSKVAEILSDYFSKK